MRAQWALHTRAASSHTRLQPAFHPRPNAPPAPAQDYSHTSVTAETFLAVLAGNASGVPPPSRHSSGRVLQAGPQDKVFVYYRCGPRLPAG